MQNRLLNTSLWIFMKVTSFRLWRWREVSGRRGRWLSYTIRSLHAFMPTSHYTLPLHQLPPPPLPTLKNIDSWEVWLKDRLHGQENCGDVIFVTRIYVIRIHSAIPLRVPTIRWRNNRSFFSTFASFTHSFCFKTKIECTVSLWIIWSREN